MRAELREQLLLDKAFEAQFQGLLDTTKALENAQIGEMNRDEARTYLTPLSRHQRGLLQIVLRQKEETARKGLEEMNEIRLALLIEERALQRVEEMEKERDEMLAKIYGAYSEQECCGGLSRSFVPQAVYDASNPPPAFVSCRINPQPRQARHDFHRLHAHADHLANQPHNILRILGAVRIVDNPAALVRLDAVLVDHPLQRRAVAEAVGERFGGDAVQRQEAVVAQLRLVFGEAHLLDAPVERHLRRFDLSERVLRLLFIADVEGGQARAGRGEGVEVGREGDARQTRA